jgi:hypothetical protein
MCCGELIAVLVVVCTVVAAYANVRYVLRSHRRAKVPLRIFNALAVLYVGFSYVVLLVADRDISHYGPTWIRPAVLVLLLLLAAEAVADGKDIMDEP